MSVYNEVEQIELAINEVLQGDENGDISLEALDILFQAKMTTIQNGLETLSKIRANKIANIEALKAEAARMADKAKSEAKKLEGLENYMLDLLKKSGESKIEAGTFTVGTRKSQSVWTAPDFNVEGFMRTKTTVEPDKTAIKDALKAGQTIEGAFLVDKENLSVR